MKFSLVKIKTVIIFVGLCILNTGCADPHFLDKTKLEGSILRGDSVESTDPIAQRTVLIAQNFEFRQNKLQYFGLCSGVILNSTTIITAAHCAKDLKNARVVTTNNAHLNQIQQKQIYNIQAAVIHENYTNPTAKKNNLNFDIALLYLDRAIENKSYDSSYLISANTADYIQVANWINLRPVIAGYGKNRTTEFKNSESALIDPINGILEKAEVQLRGEDFKGPTILIDQNDKAGACSGDSGGPLFTYRDEKLYLQGIAIAVLNHTKESTPIDSNACNNQSLYINLDFHKNWLSQKLNPLNRKE